MSRNEQIAAERRRRNSESLNGTRKRLHVDESKLDRENFAYRFANDENGRLHQLTVDDDWDMVSDRDGVVKPDGNSVGSEVSAFAGTRDNGAPLRTVLLRKRKTYYDEDEAAKQRRVDETEAGLKRGKASAASEDGMYQPESAPTTYRRGDRL